MPGIYRRKRLKLPEIFRGRHSRRDSGPGDFTRPRPREGGGASALAANGAAPLGSVRSTQRAASKEIDGVVLDGERGVRRLDLAGGKVGHLAAIEADHVMMMFGRAEHVPDQTVGL